MNRPLALLACAAVLAACAPATPRPEPVERTAPSARSLCLDPARARSFVVLRDDQTLLVDAGSDHYRLLVEPACRDVDFAFALRFRGDPVGGRVCGVHDAILTDRGECRIDRVEWISRDDYERLQAEDKLPKPAKPPKQE